MGIVAGSVNKPGQTAQEIVQGMVEEAVQVLRKAPAYVVGNPKL
jgi:hypothetical protein